MFALPSLPLLRRSTGGPLALAFGILTVMGVSGPAAALAAPPSGEVDPSQATEPVASTRKSFITPSGRIACFLDDARKPTQLTCEVRAQSGDTGMPAVQGAPEPKYCKEDFHSEWGGGVLLARTGRARPQCPSGVLVPVRKPRVLEYGTRWKRGGFVCLSRAEALRCSTTSGKHGFRYDKALLLVY